jgi:hypothetical protein
MRIAARESAEPSRSYRLGVRQHTFPDFPPQCTIRRYVNRNFQEIFQFQLDGSEIEQAGTIRGIDQEVQIAGRSILYACHGPEDPGITGAVRCYDTPHGLSMDRE